MSPSGLYCSWPLSTILLFCCRVLTIRNNVHKLTFISLDRPHGAAGHRESGQSSPRPRTDIKGASPVRRPHTGLHARSHTPRRLSITALQQDAATATVTSQPGRAAERDRERHRRGRDKRHMRELRTHATCAYIDA